MGYMGDQVLVPPFSELVKQIVGIGVDIPDLRDEVFCFIVKQMNNNFRYNITRFFCV